MILKEIEDLDRIQLEGALIELEDLMAKRARKKLIWKNVF